VGVPIAVDKRILMLDGGCGGAYTALPLERRLARAADIEIVLALWHTIYLFKLPGLQKNVRVALDWALNHEPGALEHSESRQ
jgi:hypothetical protein